MLKKSYFYLSLKYISELLLSYFHFSKYIKWKLLRLPGYGYVYCDKTIVNLCGCGLFEGAIYSLENMIFVPPVS